MITPKELAQQINQKDSPRKIHLNGNIHLTFEKSSKLIVGHSAVEGLIDIKRPDVIIDGSNAKIEVTVKDYTENDTALFRLEPSAENLQIQNLHLTIKIENPKNSNNTFSVLYSMASGLKLHNCHIDVFSDRQINMNGIYNNGNRNTHLSTLADYMSISNCHIDLTCLPETASLPCTICGIKNRLANSIVVQDSFINTINRGFGENQKAIGIDTDGRFGRFIGNNIKANATHSQGFLKEQGHAIGFVNRGMYSLISANNIVGEWAGKCIGLDSSGNFAEISGNKILATHTICGRSIQLSGNASIVSGNIITSTSRNARLIDLSAESCLVANNVMEVLINRDACMSGAGIYAVGNKVISNNITNNIIRNVKDVGVITDGMKNHLSGNIVLYSQNARSVVEYADHSLINHLDESKIQSIT